MCIRWPNALCCLQSQAEAETHGIPNSNAWLLMEVLALLCGEELLPACPMLHDSPEMHRHAVRQRRQA